MGYKIVILQAVVDTLLVFLASVTGGLTLLATPGINAAITIIGCKYELIKKKKIKTSTFSEMALESDLCMETISR